jgi:hypothetical protein
VAKELSSTLNPMINNFEDFSGHYNPMKDPYKKRSSNSLDFGFTTDESYAEVMFFQQFEDALLGIIERHDGPPCACYSQSGAITILIEEHGLSNEDAHYAITRLLETDLGPSAPCFLDTSIVER